MYGQQVRHLTERGAHKQGPPQLFTNRGFISLDTNAAREDTEVNLAREPASQYVDTADQR